MKIGKLYIGKEYVSDVALDNHGSEFYIIKTWDSNGNVWLKPADICNHNENENEIIEQSLTYDEAMFALKKMFE